MMQNRIFSVARLVGSSLLVWILTASSCLFAIKVHAQAQRSLIFTNVRIFDGTSEKLTQPSNVLVVGNTIKKISTGALTAPQDSQVVTIEGNGRTLMPGLIDAHTHLAFEILPQTAALTGDIGYLHINAANAARDMLMNGFTSARDAGGPVFGLKRAIDEGKTVGPRIWPAGAMISQSGGHGDFRLPNELPARDGDVPYAERTGASMIADGPDAVRKRVREQLALGATQIKLHAGGGVSSHFDPLDVTQYSADEMRAAVDAAQNWGTYVTVHAYTPRAVRMAIEAGVKVIEHGQLSDDATMSLIASKGVWLSLQPFLDDADAIPFQAGSANRVKQLSMLAGTELAYRLAKKYKVKTAFGTDTLFDAKLASRRGAQLAKLARWYTPYEALKMATADNAALLALSGLRTPYRGKLGVVQEGALADLLLVDGDPLANLSVLAEPATKIVVVVKDGTIYKNLVK